MYTELVRNVIQGKLAISQELAPQLCGLQLQITFGDHAVTNQDRFGMRNLSRFVPAHLLEAMSMSSTQLKNFYEKCRGWSSINVIVLVCFLC
jgi:hypothetical protein